MVEFGINDKTLENFLDKLESDAQTQLLKFIYITYERITTKQDVLGLKVNRVHKLNHQIVEKMGKITSS